MDDKYGYLYMEDSRICYNFAEWDGGGVYVDSGSDYCTIEMKNSSIDHNVSDDNGGGIHVEGDHFKLIGDARQIATPENLSVKDWSAVFSQYTVPAELGSSIAYNYVYDSKYGGGGIFLDNPSALVAGVNIIGNNATNTDDNCNGGGIYLDAEGITVRNCNILRNHADQHGGGIYNNATKNAVDSCSICLNVAMNPQNAGGGIFTWGNCELTVAGSLVVRKNTSKSYSNDNLYLSGAGNDKSDTFLIPELQSGADVHVRVASDHAGQISKAPGTYNEAWFSYDNDSSHHIGWESLSRHLWVVSGEKQYIRPYPFYPDQGSRTTTGLEVLEKTYRDYPVVKGLMQYPAFNDSSADVSSIFYYSDGLFAGSTAYYDEHLATASMCLAAAAGYSNLYGTEKSGKTLNEANDYLDKSRNFRQFVSDIGCKDEDIFVNDFNLQKPGTETIGVGIASKPIFNGKTLVIIGVRGMGYEAEWVSNMTLGAEGEAQGWSLAAGQIMAELKDYLVRKGIDGASENTIFWIAGYSRAGATANLTAKRIVDTYDNRGTHTFAYPLEAPMGGVESAKIPGNNYNCIHNVINQNDIVPWVGTTEMGFLRYGVDHFVPGSPETGEPGDGSDNNVIPEDNTAWNVGSGSYNSQRSKMLTQLSAVNPEIIFDDYFHPATINYILNALFGRDMITETDNHRWSTEAFINEFFKKLQEYAFKYDTSGNALNPSKTPRGYFSQYEIGNHRTFQQAAGATAALIFGKSNDDTAGLMECFGGLMDRMSSGEMFDIYDALEEDQIKDLMPQINKIWNKLKNLSGEDLACGYHPITDYLTDTEYQELNASFLSLTFPILCFVAVDYDKYDQDLTATLAYNISRIIANHYPEVTHAWLRSYDSFYDGDRFPRFMGETRVKAPSPVAVQISGADGTERIISGNELADAIVVNSRDTVRLLPEKASERDVGEAIYYQFTSGKPSVQGVHAYAGPFRLKEMMEDYSTDGAFTLQAVAAHNGQKLAPVTIRLEAQNRMNVSVPVSYNDGTVNYQEHQLFAGDSIKLGDVRAGDPSVSFREWKVYDNIGDPVDPQLYTQYFGEGFQPRSADTTVTNREGGSFRFLPSWDDNIESVTVWFDDVVLDDEGLPTWLSWKETGDAAWVKEHENLSWARFSDQSGNSLYEVKFILDAPAGKRFVEEPTLKIEWSNPDDYAPLQGLKPELTELRVSGRMVFISVRFTEPELTLSEPLTLGTINAPYATVRAHDLVSDTELETLTFYSTGDTVQVFAPVIPNMEFVMWQDDKSTDPDREVSAYQTVTAEYRPTVSKVEVTFSAPVAAGAALPELSGVTFDGTPCEATLEWYGEGELVRPDSLYCARIVVPKGAVNESCFAENAAAIVKAADGEELEPIGVYFDNGTSTREVYLYFMTKSQPTDHPVITAFADVSAAVPHDSTSTDILAALPDTVYGYLEDGHLIPLAAKWTEAGSPNTGDPAAQTVRAQGTLTEDMQETYALADGLSLTADVTVLAAERTANPVPMPSEGEYTGELQIALTADEGARIYYAVVTTDEGAKIPDGALLSYQEYSEPITLTALGKTTYLFTYAEKNGLENSDVSFYTYRLKEESAPAPSGGGGRSAAANPVNLPNTVDNGSVTASVNSARAGDRVTLTLTPDEGYQVSGITVADAKGSVIPVTKNEDGTYSFTMPGSAVTVTPSFAKAEELPTDGACPRDSTCPISRFTDARPADWYHDGVHWALDKGIMNGVGENTFAPNDSTSRAMIVTMLWRLDGEKDGKASAFSDVKAGSWYEKAVNWAAETGVVNGTSETSFSPDDPVTREQIVTILHRYAENKGDAEYPDANILDFEDGIDVSSWAVMPFRWAVQEGVIEGVGGNRLAPRDNATRAQVATMFMRFAKVTLQ